MPCRSLASFRSQSRYCCVILRILLDLTSHIPRGRNISCWVFNLPRRYARGLGYLLNSRGRIILTCFLYVRFRHITATMCFHSRCGPRICCCTIRCSTIGLIMCKLYLVLFFCQLPVDEFRHAVVCLLIDVAVLAPFLGHLPTVMVYHYPSSVWI